MIYEKELGLLYRMTLIFNTVLKCVNLKFKSFISVEFDYNWILNKWVSTKKFSS